MKKSKKVYLDFFVDKLTNSIQNSISGDSFQTEISILTKGDVGQISKEFGWNFNWSNELSDNSKEIYKLTIVGNPNIIQGLISLTIETDHILLNLLESSPFNIGQNKIYEGVAGNLVAFACKFSLQRGFDGYVAFIAKTKLINHYEKTLGAKLIGGHRMIISSKAANILVEKYFKEK